METVFWLQARLNESRKRAITHSIRKTWNTVRRGILSFFRYQVKLILSFLRRYIQIMIIVYPKLGQSRLVMFSSSKILRLT